MCVTVTIALDAWTFPILINGSLTLSLPVFLSPVPLARAVQIHPSLLPNILFPLVPRPDSQPGLLHLSPIAEERRRRHGPWQREVGFAALIKLLP